MELTRNELQMICNTAALYAVQQAGKPLVSTREGKAEWGAWFADAVRTGRLHPVTSTSTAPNAKRMFSRADILTLLTSDKMAARLQLENAPTNN